MKRVALISLLSLSLLSACGESKDKKEFMQACLSNSGNDDICNCTYDRIAEKYGECWGSNDALQADPEFNHLVATSIKYCATKLN
ncbi:hypothetical protein CJG67_004634 [Salmonella enterica subsp. enterica serovar Gaminara]|nr:hypothetical protein [Salmonella enterica]ECF3464452.1 hypothetical protein [Salmonella enterica subsp. enterica serovar Virchow]EDU6784786.1 hypothetical protein [Salmonella enterica subsp. enterica serovar Gaminara]HCM1650805.1 hypothetical protein [Salmonella enterica subsp. diarizonae serovar 48:i:z35]EIC5004621.1 hypothetical protein [Salmonella enterica]